MTAPADRPVSRTAAIILNWCAAPMTLHAVARLFAQTCQPDHVFVVDNGSGDNSESVLRAGLTAYGDRVTLLINHDNLGFGGGCNTALKVVVEHDFTYCWLLNNDADPAFDCLSRLVATAAGVPCVGAVGSLLIDPAHPDAAHFGSHMHPATLVSHSLSRVDDIDRHRFGWLTAASLLVSVAALRRIGLFDERYFMYWEDADLSMRLRAAGYALAAAPDAHVVHAAGTSSHNMAVRRYQWHLASQRLWLRKHHPFGRLMAPVVHAKYLLKALMDGDVARFRALTRV